MLATSSPPIRPAIDIALPIVCSVLLVLDLAPSARRSISLLFLHLHRPVHAILLVVLLLLVRVECFLALAVEDGAAALVLGDATQLVVEVSTVHLAAAILLLVLLELVGVAADRATFVVEGGVAEVLVAEARIAHGGHRVVAQVVLVRVVRPELTVDGLGAATPTRLKLGSKGIPTLHIRSCRLLE